MTHNRKSFLVSLVTGGAIAAAVCILNYTRESYAYSGAAMLLCDGFFVASVLVLGVGLLTFAKNLGYFDMLGFGVSFVLNIRWPLLGSLGRDDEKETFVDYKVRKSKSRKSAKGMLLAGCVYLGLAALMLGLYYAA